MRNAGTALLLLLPVVVVVAAAAGDHRNHSTGGGVVSSFAPPMMMTMTMMTMTMTPDNFSANASDPRNEQLAKLEITVLSVTFLVAVVGNAGVLLALHGGGRTATNKKKKTTSRMHLFIKHLSLADLVVAFFQVLPQICWKVTFRFHGPDVLCRVVKQLQVLGMFASTYVMVMMTLDRYIAVCHPLQTLRQPTRRAYAMIGGTWACSAALSVPQLFIFSRSEVKSGLGVYDCWGHFARPPWGVRAYITWITVSIFAVPVVILVLCYGFICHSIWRNVRCKTMTVAKSNPSGGSGSGSGSASASGSGVKCGGLIGKSSVSSVTIISRAKLRTVKMTFVIVLAYVVCWAPFFIVQMWSVWDLNFLFADSESAAVTLSALLASLNSCCNPWIYMIFSGHLLQDFARCLACCLCRGGRGQEQGRGWWPGGGAVEHRGRRPFKSSFTTSKEDSEDSSVRRTTLITRVGGLGGSGSGLGGGGGVSGRSSPSNWRSLDNGSPKSSLPSVQAE